MKHRPSRIYKDKKGKHYVIENGKKIYIKTNLKSDKELVKVVINNYQKKRNRKKGLKKDKKITKYPSYPSVSYYPGNGGLPSNIIHPDTSYQIVNKAMNEYKNQLAIENNKVDKLLLQNKEEPLLLENIPDAPAVIDVPDVPLITLNKIKKSKDKSKGPLIEELISNPYPLGDEELTKKELVKVEKELDAQSEELQKLYMPKSVSSKEKPSFTQEILSKKLKPSKTEKIEIEPSKFKTDIINKTLKHVDKPVEKGLIISEEEKNKLKKYDKSREIVLEDEGQDGSGWKQDGLSNFDLEELAKDLKIKNFHCIANDELLTLKPQKLMNIILNTDNHNKPGSHWVALRIDCDKDKAIEYYDSYGRDNMSKKLLEDLKVIIDELGCPEYLKLKENKIINQKNNTSSCGLLSMMFLKDRQNGKKFIEASGYKDIKEKQADKLANEFGFI